MNACAAIDLAGRDVLEAVQMSVNPKVIETPFIAGVAMNGIEVKAKARITVRANIDRLVGGAGEETIIARVGEGDYFYNWFIRTSYKSIGKSRYDFANGSSKRT